MDIMVAEGLLDTELVRQQRGRPGTRYSLSEAGEEETSGASYSRLLDRIYPALASMSGDEVSGLDGAELVNEIFDRVGATMARDHAPRITAEVFDERVQQVTNALHEEGILELVESHDELVVLRNSTCRCARARTAITRCATPIVAPSKACSDYRSFRPRRSRAAETHVNTSCRGRRPRRSARASVRFKANAGSAADDFDRKMRMATQR